MVLFDKSLVTSDRTKRDVLSELGQQSNSSLVASNKSRLVSPVSAQSPVPSKRLVVSEKRLVTLANLEEALLYLPFSPIPIDMR